MDLKDYVAILRKNWIFLLVIIIVFGLVAYLFTWKKPITYTATNTIEVAKATQKQQSLPYYEYDNYYTNLSANSISDNMVGWLSSPATVTEIYQKANLELPKGINVSDLGKTFTAKKKVSTTAVVDISLSSSDSNQASELVSSATSVLKDKVEQYNQSSDTGDFHVIMSSPVVIQDTKSFGINIAIAAFAGLLIGLAVAFGRESLKK
jgi:capsular polysaccharide biosynthesis protein